MQKANRITGLIVLFWLVFLTFPPSVICQESKRKTTPMKPSVLIQQSKIRYKGAWFDNGYAIPKDGFKLAVLYFENIDSIGGVSSNDLKWSFKTKTVDSLAPIGIAVPVGQLPAQMVGQLKSGRLHSLSGGKYPLVGLVFVIPQDQMEIQFSAPDGKQLMMKVNKQWKPSKENQVEGFSCDGSISGPIEGENWHIGR